MGILIPFVVEKFLEDIKAWEQIKNYCNPIQLEVNIASDDKNIHARLFQVSVLHRNDCKVRGNGKDFFVSCSKAIKGESIHFEVLSGDMLCGKFDRQIGSMTPEDIPIDECVKKEF